MCPIAGLSQALGLVVVVLVEQIVPQCLDNHMRRSPWCDASILGAQAICNLELQEALRVALSSSRPSNWRFCKKPNWVRDSIKTIEAVFFQESSDPR